MPATVPGVMGALIPSLASATMIGTGVPKYALGVAIGLTQWIPQVRVNTIDTGTAGAGKNVPLPLLVPNPLVYGNLILGMTQQGLVGTFMPVFVAGLTNGLVLSFLQMIINTVHPSVGTGAGVARFSAPPAARSMISGFTQAGMNGDASVKKAKALGSALDRTFASLIMPVAIVGPSAPSPGAGSGFGGIL